MKILKVIACLLSYPTEEAYKHRAELSAAISDTRLLPPEMRQKMLDALDAIYLGELLDAEENYSLLFDQGRSLSLHLFEHVHGESRDRGQAMVDLMAIYKHNGYELDAHELPDYLPLFLEYLSTRPDIEAREWLADVSHIIATVSARLYERSQSETASAEHYALLLEALLIIAGKQAELDESTRQKIASETPDNTPEAIDQEWEETAVTFGAPESCNVKQPSSPDSTQTLHWVDSPSARPTPPSATKTPLEGGSS